MLHHYACLFSHIVTLTDLTLSILGLGYVWIVVSIAVFKIDMAPSECLSPPLGCGEVNVLALHWGGGGRRGRRDSECLSPPLGESVDNLCGHATPTVLYICLQDLKKHPKTNKQTNPLNCGNSHSKHNQLLETSLDKLLGWYFPRYHMTKKCVRCNSGTHTLTHSYWKMKMQLFS